MNKRIILAIALSFIVMLIWARLTRNTYNVERQEVTEKIIQPLPVKVLPESDELSLTSVVSSNRELVFSLPSACLNKVKFLQFGDEALNLEQGLCLAEEELVFSQEKLTSKEAIFVHQDEKKKITKHFNYSDPNFLMTLDVKIENLSEQSLSYPSGLILGTIDLSSRGMEQRFREIFLKDSQKIHRLNPGRESKAYAGEFFGFRNRYFCAILIPISFPETLKIVRLNRTKSQISLSRPMIELLPNQIGHLQYKIYLGPQQAELLKEFQNGTEEIIYYGFFDPIAKLLLNILRFFSNLLHNLGWAIIILSVLIFFVLFPLSLRQMRSMKEMQHLQPKIEELRRANKDNPQKLNKEMLGLYRQHKVNPLGGCLPIFLQIPIFFSLFQALMRSIELKGANFLWIKDLSQPDRLIVSPEINILPILMAVIMFLQQKFTMAPSAGSSTEQQRLMSFFLPILFGFIFYRMPSGLVLYWFVNSLLMFIFQTKIKPIRKPDLASS